MAVRPSDLTSSARIRNAALELFSRNGLAKTSIRDVAAAAGVSAGLVQHHFKTKAGLRDAVNDYVIALAVETFGGMVEGSGSADPVQEAGDRITAFVRANPAALRYVGRALVEGDEPAREIFDAFVGVTLANLRDHAKRSALQRGLDIEWAAMHLVIFNLGVLLFEEAINGQLARPFFSEEELQRWNVATTELYRKGMFHAEVASAKRSRK